MQEALNKILTDYVVKHDLTQNTIETYIKDKSYISFFNDLTVLMVGKPNYTHDKTNKTVSALVYIPKASKNKYVDSTSVISIDSFYMGVISKLTFNYPKYNDLLETLFHLRKSIKTGLYFDGYDEIKNTVQILIKKYLNLVYGMINNTKSVLTSELDNPQQYIVRESKTAILMIIELLLNRGLPIYYVDTDEIHTGTVSNEIYTELNEYFTTEVSKVINTNISKISIDSNSFLSSYYVDKKKYLLGKDIEERGLKRVVDKDVRKENKQYFGENYPEFFPEYTF